MAQKVGLNHSPICVSDVAGRLNYLTQHYDNARTGWNPHEQVLTVAKVENSFGWLFDLDLQDANAVVRAQPLYLRNVAIPSQGLHNVVFVATMSNVVYAFDADKPMPWLWRSPLTTPTEQPFHPRDSDCGILATPAIDLRTSTLYAVTHSQSPDGSQCRHRLFALDVATGAERPGSPIEIKASVSGTDQNGNPATWHLNSCIQLNRPGLLLENGRLYLGFGSVGFLEDGGGYHGWVLAFDAAALQQVGVFNATPDKFPTTGGVGAGIWQAGRGLAADSEGYIYLATANGLFNANEIGGRNYGDSVLKLRPDLTVADYFTPCNQNVLSGGDFDLGSGGVMIVPGAQVKYLVACGKEAKIYVLDRDNLGKYTQPVSDPCHDNVADSRNLYEDLLGRQDRSTFSGVFGGPAYYESGAAKRIYYCSKPWQNGPPVPLGAWTIDSGGKIRLIDRSLDTFSNGAIPVVSSNGATDGIVWLVDAQLASTHLLYGYEAMNLSHRLVRINAGACSATDFPPYPVPTVINGKVYVGSQGRVMVFG
jgi:hypothetical protein